MAVLLIEGRFLLEADPFGKRRMIAFQCEHALHFVFIARRAGADLRLHVLKDEPIGKNPPTAPGILQWRSGSGERGVTVKRIATQVPAERLELLGRNNAPVRREPKKRFPRALGLGAERKPKKSILNLRPKFRMVGKGQDDRRFTNAAGAGPGISKRPHIKSGPLA